MQCASRREINSYPGAGSSFSLLSQQGREMITGGKSALNRAMNRALKRDLKRTLKRALKRADSEQWLR